jgi:hypothetical protein
MGNAPLHKADLSKLKRGVASSVSNMRVHMGCFALKLPGRRACVASLKFLFRDRQAPLHKRVKGK